MIALNIRKLANIINKDGVVLIPTDTIYGLSADATSDVAISKIYNIKSRAQNKPMLILASSEEMVYKYVKVTNFLEEKLKSFF